MIKIEELDESEDLTVDMVRAWLRENGFTLTGDQYGEGPVWVSGNGKRIYDSRILTADGLKWLALVSEVSPQSLLREINPRMRAGWPSEEEIRAHDQRGGLWLCLDADESAMVVGRFVSATRFRHTEWLRKPGVVGYGVDKECGARLQFWPCDQHGNKTRRGA